MSRHLLALLCLGSTAAPLRAAVVDHMTPPPSLSPASLAVLPAASRAVWAAYLSRSAAALARDKAVLAAERATIDHPPAPPPEARNGSSMPLDRNASWYADDEARAIGVNIISYQTPAGGWGKNQDRTAPPRQPGQMYLPFDSKAGSYASADLAGGWSFVGTIDNDATTTELSFLARLQATHSAADGDAYRASFLRGIGYLLVAQMPTGGWPQVYPLQGGYHDALTLNDDAMVEVTDLLQRAAQGQGDYAFVPPNVRGAARAAAERSIAALLASQVVTGGRRTIWAQQYDPLTLKPVGARNFEPVALATAESAAVLRFLMTQSSPSPAIRSAISDGVAWFETHAVHDQRWGSATDPEGRKLIATPGAPSLWARFYDPVSGKPIFGDRDRSVHDDVNELSLERRNGYSWFGNSGSVVAAAYAKWQHRS